MGRAAASRVAASLLALVALAAVAGARADQRPAVPRLLQPTKPPAAQAWETVRTPTLVFKATAWPAAITTAALVHGSPGWPTPTVPPLVFKAVAWPSPVAVAALVYRGGLAPAPPRPTVRPAAAAASISNRSLR